MKIIDGNAVANSVKSEVKLEVSKLKTDIGLAVIIVGENSASRIYVNNKKKACDFCGIRSFEHVLPDNVSETTLLNLIQELNQDSQVHGILVQQPLPKHISVQKVNDCISFNKDVDCFNPINVGRVMLGSPGFLPCTPAGVMRLLSSENIDVKGKNCVVLGRSDIVGKPMAMLLLHAHGTVSICHSKTQNLTEHTRKADILVSAIGKTNFISADMIKEGAVVVDVGMNRDNLGNLCGDVDFASVSPKTSFITPVPGGVGPMTVAMLMKNTLYAAQNAQKG